MPYRKTIFTISLIIICASNYACVSTKASAEKWDIDAQNRIHCEKPYFEKKLTPVGWSVSTLLTISTTYLGYIANLFSQPSDDNEIEKDIYSSLVGTLTGIGLSSFGNILQGHTEKEYLQGRSEQEKWLNLYGDEYVVMDNFYANTLVIIEKTKEQDFKFTTAKDVADFLSAFPDSEYFDANMQSSLPEFNWNSLLSLIDLMHFDLGEYHQKMVWDHMYLKANTLSKIQEAGRLADAYIMKKYEEKAKEKAFNRAISLPAESLLTELSELLNNYNDSPWIPKLVNQLESKLNSEEFDKIASIFERNYAIDKAGSEHIYLYIPPRGQGIVTLNDVLINDIDATLDNYEEDYRLKPFSKERFSVNGIGNIISNQNALMIINNPQEAGGITVKATFKNNSDQHANICFSTIDMNRYADITGESIKLRDLEIADYLFSAIRQIGSMDNETINWDKYVNLESKEIDQNNDFKLLVLNQTMRSIKRSLPELSPEDINLIESYFEKLLSCANYVKPN